MGKSDGFDLFVGPTKIGSFQTSIQDDGLAADVTVEMTQEIFDSEGDVQLAKAIEVVKSL